MKMKGFETRKVSLGDIVVNEFVNVRELDMELVEEYKTDMVEYGVEDWQSAWAGNGGRLRTVEVDGVLHLYGGFHTHRAASAAWGGGHEVEVLVNVDPDIPEDCRVPSLLAGGENASHGKRRTNVEKGEAVDRWLKCEHAEDSNKWSDGYIAKRCSVSKSFVMVRDKALREELGEEYVRPDERFYMRKGKMLQADVDKNRTSVAEASPAEEDAPEIPEADAPKVEDSLADAADAAEEDVAPTSDADEAEEDEADDADAEAQAQADAEEDIGERVETEDDEDADEADADEADADDADESGAELRDEISSAVQNAIRGDSNDESDGESRRTFTKEEVAEAQAQADAEEEEEEVDGEDADEADAPEAKVESPLLGNGNPNPRYRVEGTAELAAKALSPTALPNLPPQQFVTGTLNDVRELTELVKSLHPEDVAQKSGIGAQKMYAYLHEIMACVVGNLKDVMSEQIAADGLLEEQRKDGELAKAAADKIAS